MLEHFTITFDLIEVKAIVEPRTPGRPDLKIYRNGDSLADYQMMARDYSEASRIGEEMRRALAFGLKYRPPMANLVVTLDLGKIAYDGYCCASGGKSHISGALLPDWSDLESPIQNSWQSAALALLNAVYPASDQRSVPLHQPPGREQSCRT